MVPSLSNGWRNAWVAKAWPRDTAAVTRWIELVTTARVGQENVELLRRVLGWDPSLVPAWAAELQSPRVNVTKREFGVSTFLELLDPSTRIGVESSKQEVRRLEPPVLDWHGAADSKLWALQVPLVVYEVWADAQRYGHALDLWNSLTSDEKRISGIGAAHIGYLGSSILLLPQRRPFLASIRDIVIPGGLGTGADITLVSEVFDGSIVLSRSSKPLVVEPLRALAPSESLRYLQVHSPPPTFCEMNAVDRAGPKSLALGPTDAHGHSGSDWRLTMLGPNGVCDAMTVGLIRGLGDGYITSEPWFERAPGFGFSAPARVTQVSPSSGGATIAFDALNRVGARASICDPYAESASLARLTKVLAGGRILTSTTQAHRIDRAWALSLGVSVRASEKLHDRFLVGPRRAFLVGASINGLGNRHSFLVELDIDMRIQVASIFETLWGHAQPVF